MRALYCWDCKSWVQIHSFLPLRSLIEWVFQKSLTNGIYSKSSNLSLTFLIIYFSIYLIIFLKNFNWD
jgi:hypothetical protein